MPAAPKRNIDPKTVEGFGDEWEAFDQISLDAEEHRRLFDIYFRLFPFEKFKDGEGFDLGCGSGRWAYMAAPRVGRLHCIDPSPKALDVCRRRMAGMDNVEFHVAGVDDIPLADESQDFGYSLGVLHHIPDTEDAMARCVAKLKPGAPFLVYLYYRFDNRAAWFRGLWKVSNVMRRGVSRLPFGMRRLVCEAMALSVYYPLARGAALAERAGADVSSWPLSAYRDCSFYTMRTDALDRFGTRLEHRFTKAEIAAMMTRVGLTELRFNHDEQPFWVAIGWKRSRMPSDRRD